MNEVLIYHLAVLLFQSMLNPSSDQADRIYRLFNYFNVAAFGMLGLVTFLTFYIIFKYRKKDDDRKAAQFKGNNKLEALMIGGPTLLVAFFFYQTVKTINAVEPNVENYRQPDVIVTGHQFWWEVEYPKSGVVTANEVHLPVNKKVLLELRSADVIHDWWVPELGNKMDLIPNRVNHLWLNINKPATYAGVCSEFCGAQHAWMRLDVIAQDETSYNEWIAANSKKPIEPTGELALKGAQIFQAATCANCHKVEGTTAAGVAGPNLTHIGLRRKMLAGMMDVNEANLYLWISDPQKIKPGAKMPNFIYSKDTLNALAAYMSQLK